MVNKKVARLRRCKRTRAHLKNLAVHRLSVHRTAQHIYAQVIAPQGGKVLASASTLDPVVRKALTTSTGNAEAAKVVGKLVAERALEQGVAKIGFDRSGFQYHGRVRALAEAARLAGLQF